MASDVHIISGMDAIINPDNIKSGIDLKDLEHKMISGGIIQQRSRDPADKFNDELKDAAKRLGISFDQYTRKESKTVQSKLPSVSIDSPKRTLSPKKSLELHSLYSPNSQHSPHSPNSQHSPQKSPKRSPPPTPSDSEDNSEQDNDNDDNDRAYTDQEDRNQSTPSTFARSPSKYGMDLTSRTQEQERRSHIDSIMGDSSVGFSLEKEKREDLKSSMLAEIDSLISILSDEDIDLSRIPKVTQNSSYEEVEAVLRMLRHKNDHTRYCTFAEEFMLFGAYAMEELFDGKRTWFGRYQPDLTGWHNHVNVKLKRMRHDTGQLVSNVMQDYNIGSGMRILLELVPSVILYSRMRKSQHQQPGLFIDDDMAGANARLSDIK